MGTKIKVKMELTDEESELLGIMVRDEKKPQSEIVAGFVRYGIDSFMTRAMLLPAVGPSPANIDLDKSDKIRMRKIYNKLYNPITEGAYGAFVYNTQENYDEGDFDVLHVYVRDSLTQTMEIAEKEFERAEAGGVFAVRVVDSNKKTVYELRRSGEDKDE